MAEQFLSAQTSELFYEQALNALQLPVVMVDQRGSIVASNSLWQRFSEDPNQRGFLGENYLAVFARLQILEPSELTACQQGLEDILAGRRTLFEFSYRRVLEARDHWFQMQVTPLQPLRGAVISHFDITERWQTETQMTMLLESPIDALMIVDHEGLIQMVNGQMEGMFGYTRDELFGQTMEILLPHRFRRQHRQHVAGYMERPRLRQMGTGLELYGLRKDGSEFPVEISLNPLQSAGTPLVSAAIRDVSERKRAEMQLARLARILETSHNEIYFFDATTLRFNFVNQGARHNLGYTMDDLATLTPLDLKPEFNVTSFERLLQPLREGTKSSLHFSTLHQRKDGSRYPVDVYLQLFHNETPPLFAAIIIDTSERDATQKALWESQQRVAMHVENTPLAVLEWRVGDQMITAWNPAAERLFGYRAAEMIGQRRIDIVVPEEQRAKLETIMRGTISHAGFRNTSKNITKDGRLISCEWHYASLGDADGEGERMAALVLDVTARQRAINELLTVQEEERSRISKDLHDHVGQLLTGLNLGLSAVAENPEKHKLLDLKALGATILDDVRRISRDLRPALLDELGLAAAIKRFVRELAQESLKVDVLVRVPDTLERDTATVIYRVAQEALTNIVRHAKARHASVVVTTSEDALQLIVEDDGIGFDPNAVAAFEHIGLSSMRERVELLGGTFNIESLHEKGTTISARLPLPSQ
jgi:PAS domain S-box-containing protein